MKAFVYPENLEQRFLPPKNLEIDFFENRHGQSIRTGLVLPEQTPPSCLIVIAQGLSEFGEKYSEFMHEQLSLGRACAFIDWTYQGGSARYFKNPQKRHSNGFEEDVLDLQNFIHKMLPHKLSAKGLVETPPLVILGHSMGAGISLIYMRENPGRVIHAALSAPMIRIRFPLPDFLSSITRKAIRTCNKFWPDAYAFPGGDYSDVSRPKDIQKDVLSKDPVRHLVHRKWIEANPDLAVGNVTWGWLAEALKLTDTLRAPSFPDLVPDSITIGTAGHDKLVSSRAAESLAKKLPRGECVRYDQSYHEILMERDEIRRPFLSRFNQDVSETLSHLHSGKQS